MNQITNLIRSDLREFIPYSSARKETITKQIMLNANESPWPNDATACSLNRYPEPQPQTLIERLAALYKVKSSQVLLSRGSDEAIDLLIRLFCEANKDAIMICPPCFGMYAVCAKLQAANIINTPLIRNNFQLDLPSILDNWNPSVKILFLCSPNNPTGNCLIRDEILFLCKALRNKCIIVVDEAYIEYAEVNSLSGEIDNYENLVILRTLSKAYGLAAARCGAAIANPTLIKCLKNIMAPYPITKMSNAIAKKTLKTENLKKINQQINCIREEKRALEEQLKKYDFINKIFISDANFILIQLNNSQKLLNFLNDRGIAIRKISKQPTLTDCIRITVGTPKENQTLIRTLDNYNPYTRER